MTTARSTYFVTLVRRSCHGEPVGPADDPKLVRIRQYGDGDDVTAQVDLLPSEARSLAAQLVYLADLADGVRRIEP